MEMQGGGISCNDPLGRYASCAIRDGLASCGTIVGNDVSDAVVEAGQAWQKATLAGITLSADGTDPTWKTVS